MAVAEFSSHHTSGHWFSLAGLVTTLSAASSLASLGVLAVMAAPMLGFAVPFGLAAAAFVPLMPLIGLVNLAVQTGVEYSKTGQIINWNLAMSLGPMAAVMGMTALGFGDQRWWLTLGLSLVGLVGAVKNKGYLSGTASVGWVLMALAQIFGASTTPITNFTADNHATQTQTAAAVQVQAIFAAFDIHNQCGPVLLAHDTSPADIQALANKNGITLAALTGADGRSIGDGAIGQAIVGQTADGKMAHVILIDTDASVHETLAKFTTLHELDHVRFNCQHTSFNTAGDLVTASGITGWMREVHADLAAFIGMSSEERQFILTYKDAHVGEVYDTAAVMRYAAEQIPTGLTMKDPQVQSFIYRLAFEAAHGMPASTTTQAQWASFDGKTPSGQYVTEFRSGHPAANTFPVSSSTAPVP